MLLSARMLTAVSSVNRFEIVDAVEWTEGDTLSVYFQLIDASLDRPAQGFNPPGRRFMPAASATLTVSINSIDSTKTYTKTATQPYSLDPSIWKIDIASTDAIVGSRDIILTLTEGATITRGRVQAALKVYSRQASY
jgi:hypothetical protein